MRLYKLIVTGTDENDFKIDFTYSDDFVNYKSFNFEGTEQEKYDLFLKDLQAHKGNNPILIKCKMKKIGTDRAFARNVFAEISDVKDFVIRLGR